METPEPKQSTYLHTPLPDPARYIRLLTIDTVEAGPPTPVHCSLSLWAAGSQPAYHAISYTWGNPDEAATILVDGRAMTVRRNCEYVLRQASLSAGASHRYWWIDAICINQNDEVEKGPQVAMMSSIYREAEGVLACVGEHGDDSDYLFEHIKLRLDGLSRSAAPDASFAYTEIAKAIMRAMWPWSWSGDHSATTTPDRLCKALSAFAARPYFHRVWVYQELCLGARISVRCGADELAVSTLRAFAALLQARWPAGAAAAAAVVPPAFLRMVDAGTLGPTTHGSQLQHAVRAVRALRCQDPRDRVYGTLFLVEWNGEPPIAPDYARDALDLAVDVVTRVLWHPAAELYMFHHLLSTALLVAEALGVAGEPSPRLVEAVRKRTTKPLRQTSASSAGPGHEPVDRSHSHTTWLRSHRLTRHCFGQHSTPFVGWRLSYNHSFGPWELRQKSHLGRLGLGHGLSGQVSKPGPKPEIRQWAWKSSLVDKTTQVLLQPETRDGDVLLIPCGTSEVLGFADTVALTARGRPDNSGSLEIIGKALLESRGSEEWLSEVVLTLDDRPYMEGASIGGETGTKVDVHMDAEDVLMLLKSCQWDPKFDFLTRSGKELDEFFCTRVHGSIGSSDAAWHDK